MVTASWFISALEARNNIVKDIAVHGEISDLEMQVLLAVQRGDYEVTVDGGTPMTENSDVLSHVFSVDLASNSLYIPNHDFATGDIVTVSSTGQLPPPLVAGVYYYVIYLDANHIKLATSKSNATAGISIPIDLDQGVTAVSVDIGGSGYLSAPTVSFSGGQPNSTASARAVLETSGSIYSVSLLTNSSGFVSTPSVSVVPPGSGAAAGSVTFKTVAVSVLFGGNNYNVNDLLSLLTGVGTTAVFRVTGVSGGSVTSVSIVSAGNYSVLPTLVGSITNNTGIGGGCSLNLTMGINGIAVGTGGLNYVNPPLVSIAGGGGTGAVAVARLTGGAVSSFVISNPGSGFDDPGSIVIEISSGEDATAVVQLAPTSVADIELTDTGGDNYLNPPSVQLTTPGTGATAGTVYMKTVSASLRNAGVNYAVGDQLLVSGGTGTANTIIQVLTVNNQGVILTYNIINSGSYTVLPTLLSNNVYGGTGQGASFDLTMGVGSVDVALGGSGYVVPPLVVLSGGDPHVAASAASVISGGVVSTITVEDPGHGYSSVPTVVLTMGSGATAVATLLPSSIDQVAPINPGSGYTVPPTVVISGGGGSGAVAEATISGGSVDNIILLDPGSGYTSNPTIQLFGDGVGATAGIARFLTAIDYVSVTNAGSNYIVTPSVVIGGAGTAAGYAVMNSTSISAVRITDPGSNYTSDPLLAFTDGPGQVNPPVYPTVKVNRQFSVDYVSMLAPGSGYQSVPSVAFSAPQALGGSAATGTASIGVGPGMFSIREYTPSLDYYKVMVCGPSGSNGTSNSLIDRPYADQMNAVIKYFTDLGYTITRATNPATGNTFVWVIKW